MHSRRDFLRLGVLGGTGVTLADFLRLKARAAQDGVQVKDKSVIWLWLSGGPTHVETFDPKMSAPVEFRSMTGAISTKLPGVTLGGTFDGMASVADKMTFVRSYQVGNNSHSRATFISMTGGQQGT